ncbi:MAG: molybdopterin molybdotransferase MoeA [Rhodospirillaceae bacterium]|nr:molybdopterin molybdotransferase MoeA [Rhodospirillaceae bacterium]
MISVEQAQCLVRDTITPVGTESISLSGSFGRVLAESPTARIAHPTHTVSAMDGYAVRANNIPSTPGKLTVIGESAAGHPFEGSIKDGQAVRIFTGAHIPQDSDTVVIQEDVESDGNTIIINSIEPGRHIRPKAQDFSEGDSLLTPPLRLATRHVGLLASGDRPWIQVFQRPRVAIISTGDEIVLPGEPRTSSQIVSANGPALSAFIQAKGGIPIHLGVVKDDEDALSAITESAMTADLIVTSGGVSVGDHDLVRKALGNAGVDVKFHKIAMRPGKPVIFGHLDKTPVLGLPGNPVSALICALLFLGPAIDRLQGLPGSAPKRIPAVLGADVNANGGREDYMRAVLSRNKDGNQTATPIFAQDSSMIGALANSDALIVRPIEAPAAKTGQAVPVIPLDGLL